MKLNENSELQIPLRNLISLIIAVAIGVWGYFSLTERLSYLENELANGSKQVEGNTAWINSFKPPPEVQDTIVRVRTIEERLVKLETVVDGHVNRKR